MELLPGLYQPRQFMQQISDQASSNCLLFLPTPLFGDLHGESDVTALKPLQSQVLCGTPEEGIALWFQVSLFQCKIYHLEVINLAVSQFLHLQIA